MRYILALLAVIAVAFSTPALAIPDTVACNGLDSSTSNAGFLALIQNCQITTGPDGIIFLAANGQTSCDQESVRVFVVPGTVPTQLGSNMIGGVSSGVLTVTSAAQFSGIPGLPSGGGFNTPFTIENGQTLTGVGINVAGVTVTSETMSTENGNPYPDGCGTLGTAMALGGCGTYNVSSMALTRAPGGDFFGLDQVPGGALFMNTTVTSSACQVGFSLVAIGASISGLTPNASYWIGVEIATGGTFMNWTNSNMAIILY